MRALPGKMSDMCRVSGNKVGRRVREKKPFVIACTFTDAVPTGAYTITESYRQWNKGSMTSYGERLPIY